MAPRGSGVKTDSAPTTSADVSGFSGGSVETVVVAAGSVSASGSSWIGGSAGVVVMVRFSKVDGVVGEVGDVGLDEEVDVVGDVVAEEEDRRRRKAGARSVKDFRRDAFGGVWLDEVPLLAAAAPDVPVPLPLDPGRAFVLVEAAAVVPVVVVPAAEPVPGVG